MCAFSNSTRYRYAEGKPVCMHSCNLQKGIRRAVCNLREGTLPDDCPRFPWAKIWWGCTS
jgi:hypothetical protein